MGVLEFLVPFYPINTAWVVFSSDLKMDPLNLYPIHRIGGAGYPTQGKMSTALRLRVVLHAGRGHVEEGTGGHP